MKKIVFAFFVLSLLILSGCKESVTGKSVAEPEKKAEILDEKISECARLCNDDSQSPEDFVNSCKKIMQYGGEGIFNAYVEQCKK